MTPGNGRADTACAIASTTWSCTGLADLSKQMWDLSDFLVTTIGGIERLSGSLHHRNHDHDVIRIAIRSQNPDVARAAMESHIVGTVAAFSATRAQEREAG